MTKPAPLTGRLANEIVLVTGAAGPDIGQATARAFVLEGATVIVTDRSARRVETVTNDLAQMGSNRVIGFVLDLRSPDKFPETLREVTIAVGHPTILVNCAAVTKIVALDEMSFQDWDEILSINLRSSWILSCLLAKEMKLAGKGAIINVSSVAAYSPGWNEGAYSISKAGLNALTRDLAYELGPFGIRCNTVAPAFVDSTFIREHWSRYSSFVDRTPLGRFVTPDEVASAVVFLASDAASGITGEVINVSAGWHMPA